MDLLIETTKKLRDVHFIHIEISEPGLVTNISVEGFVDKAHGVFELTYIDVGDNPHGKGLGRKALQKLHEVYKEIHVFAIQPQAIGFWCRMFSEKLVDSLHHEVGHLHPAKQRIWNSL